MTEKRLAFAIEVALRAPDDHPFQVGVLALRSSLGVEGLTLALLHDSAEDGYLTDNEYVGLPQSLKLSLMALTRTDGESYNDYIERLRQGPLLAVLVKICDLRVNLERILYGPTHNPTLVHRYKRAIERLSQFES